MKKEFYKSRFPDIRGQLKEAVSVDPSYVTVDTSELIDLLSFYDNFMDALCKEGGSVSDDSII